ncbi:hypothetical protein ROT00_17745 [Agromyces mediolanus]|uniref:hypothetical protein n=1 Tax=Agromyces mediolanus TaxID=41986 RepID=UPI0038385002
MSRRARGEASSRGTAARRRWLPALGGAALLAAAWGLAAVTPGDDAAERPFVVEAAPGERAEGRNLAIVVTGLAAARTVVDGGWRAEGDWLVVELEAEAVVAEQAALLGSAVLEFDGRSYRASERPPGSLLRTALAVGLPRSGAVAFELPPGTFDAAAAEGAAPASLAFAISADTRLDSLLVVPFDLAQLEPSGEVELPRIDWAGS